MFSRLLILAILMAFSPQALGQPTSPIFGSSTQTPVIIVINPETGLPVAIAGQAEPAIASAQ